MTVEEKAELEALEAKGDTATAEEKSKLTALKVKAAAGGEKTFTEDYVKALRAENAKYRTRAKEVEEKLAMVANIDPKEYEKLLAEKLELEHKKLIDKGEFETIRKQLVEQSAKELAKKDAEKLELSGNIQKLTDDLNLTILRQEISAAASIAKAINPALVEMVAIKNMKIDTAEDGKRSIYVLDGKGEVRKDLKSGDPIRVITLLEEMKQSPEYAHLFSGGNAGAGSGTLQFGGQAIANPWKGETLNLTLQGKIVKESPEMAARLKAEAGVK